MFPSVQAVEPIIAFPLDFFTLRVSQTVWLKHLLVCACGILKRFSLAQSWELVDLGWLVGSLHEFCPLGIRFELCGS